MFGRSEKAGDSLPSPCLGAVLGHHVRMGLCCSYSFQMFPLHQFSHHVGLHPGHTKCYISPFPRLDQSGIQDESCSAMARSPFMLLDAVCWLLLRITSCVFIRGATVVSGCDCVSCSLVVFHTGLLSCFARGFGKGPFCLHKQRPIHS